MRDVTELFRHYRITARSVWNIGFWPRPELRTWNSWDRFEEVKKSLFKGLVLTGVLDLGCCGEAPNVLFKVVPSAPVIPIMVNNPREGDHNIYWDDPVREIEASQAELLFLDYFDWDIMGYIDFQYYRVRIVAFPSQPRLVGREALVETLHAGVFVADNSDVAI